jgi:hypothetical protein|tara:strand:- start:2834 stop:3310 length:477 start_codon:yes stop_codon:yes gene_type:complete
MAKYGLFDIEHKNLKFIAEDETERDLILGYNPCCKGVAISDAQFENAGNYNLQLNIDDSDNVVESAMETAMYAAEDLATCKSDQDVYTNNWTRSLNFALAKLPADHADRSTWATFKTKLDEVNLDTAGLTFPPNKSFMQWFSEQDGVPAKKALQIPFI